MRDIKMGDMLWFSVVINFERVELLGEVIALPDQVLVSILTKVGVFCVRREGCRRQKE